MYMLLFFSTSFPTARLLLLFVPVFSQFQVIYRENNDELFSNSSEPIRFWELVEYRPTQATTTTTTTPDPCESSIPGDLSRRLRDTAGYNEIYLASDFASARNAFPDLRTLAHRPPTTYECGRRCQRSSRLIRRMIRTGSPARTWWDEQEWRRRRRVSDEHLLIRNTGTSRHVLGMTVAVECDDSEGGFDSGGYSICSSCRAVRHLPPEYFPRVVNEVICSQSSCLHGEGKCVQRVMPMKILRNVGTRECARWQLSSIDIRTCCDCVLNPSSPLVSYL